MLFDSRIFNEKRFVGEDPNGCDYYNPELDIQFTDFQAFKIPRDSFYIKGLWHLYNKLSGRHLTPGGLANKIGAVYLEPNDDFDSAAFYVSGTFNRVDNIVLLKAYGPDNNGGDTNKQRFLKFINSDN